MGKYLLDRHFIYKCTITVLLLLFVSSGSPAQNTDSTKAKQQTPANHNIIVDSSRSKSDTTLRVLLHTKRTVIPILQDSDGDGVPDQLDLEPNTPRGAEVDSHGRAIDTDGDGVPDYRDKEKLTPRSCFPVNRDGYGLCPEPVCCRESRQK